MAWEKFNPNLAAHDLVQDLKWNVELRKEFKANESSVLDRYKLLPEERAAVAFHLGQRRRQGRGRGLQQPRRLAARA